MSSSALGWRRRVRLDESLQTRGCETGEMVHAVVRRCARRCFVAWGLLVLVACQAASDDAVAEGTGTENVAPAGSSTVTEARTSVAADSTSTSLNPGTSTTASPSPPRVLLVGDSTLLAVESYETEAALTGFDPVLEVASCRTLGVPSCGDEPVPPNSVETIRASIGPFDGVVIMAGYDEWWTTFPTSVKTVMEVSRAQGARWVLWLTYPEDVPYRLPDGRAANEAFMINNSTLEDFAADPAFDDLFLADWATFSDLSQGWIGNDGIHLSPSGAYAVADYISRWVAHLTAAPCPQPLVAGGPIAPVCERPDLLDVAPDIDGLYRQQDEGS